MGGSQGTGIFRSNFDAGLANFVTSKHFYASAVRSGVDAGEGQEYLHPETGEPQRLRVSSCE